MNWLDINSDMENQITLLCLRFIYYFYIVIHLIILYNLKKYNNKKENNIFIKIDIIKY